MASIGTKIANKAIAVTEQGDTLIRTSKIPKAVQFPLLTLLSLTLSSLLYSFTADLTAGDLARVSRRLDSWWQVGALMGWRGIVLALGWYGNYDGYDLASLSILSHGPPLYLLGTFYNVSTVTVLSSLAIDVLTTYVPFRLLRPLSLAHAAGTSTHSIAVPNDEIVTSTEIQMLTTTLAASIYAVTLFTAYSTYLPVYLAQYFDGIPTIAAAHSATVISLLPITLLLGIAAKSFIFTPATVAVPGLAEARRSAFNPANATLTETFWYNYWGYSKRTKLVIQRTATLMLVSGINTFIQTFVTVEGVDAVGAVGYSGVWTMAALVTGVVLGYVGAV